MLESFMNRIRHEVAETGGASVAGYVAGIRHDGGQALTAHGLANPATGVPMTEDTGFLLGSVTKVLTTALVLRYVESGALDLDERVTTYLPEFALATEGHAERVTIRQLVDHTNGIDADLLIPDVSGPDALRVTMEYLRDCETLFAPGEYVSYSNPGFDVAGRVLEVVAGRPFEALLERELFAPIGMANSCTSADRAILRRTAIGALPDDENGGLRRTDRFSFPGSLSAAGGTPITTIEDLLAFGATMLADGVAPSGRRVLASELCERMRTAGHDMGTPNIPPIGLGWWLVPFGQTVAWWHAGTSPGGTSHLVVLPEYDVVFAAFATGPGGILLHDRITLALVCDELGVAVPELPVADPTEAEPTEAESLDAYAGTYVSNQLRVSVRVDGTGLEEGTELVPMDDDHARLIAETTGDAFPAPAQRLRAIRPNLFAPETLPSEMVAGVLGRTGLTSFHEWRDGRPNLHSSGMRLRRARR